MITLKLLLSCVVVYHMFIALRNWFKGWNFLKLLKHQLKVVEKGQKLYDTKVQENKVRLFQIAWRIIWFTRFAVLCAISYLCYLGINTL